MDIRDFVKIKRIPGGSLEDCSIVKGEVFSNRVIRVGMPLSMDNTNILLVKDSIAYAREDRLELNMLKFSIILKVLWSPFIALYFYLVSGFANIQRFS